MTFTESLTSILKSIDDFVWGPIMLVLLVGTGIFLTVRLKFLPWRNLGYALRLVTSKESRSATKGNGDVSPFAALMTALASTIGTGNIVGVATALVSGGPGALVWMWISALFGLSTKFSECMLSIKYREVNEKGEMSGGPMYTLKHAFKHKKLGYVLGFLFALFASIAAFGIGNMTQANSISDSLKSTFNIPLWITGIILTVLVLIVVVGGIKNISRVASIIVPVMATFYIIAGLIVIIGNVSGIPEGLHQIFTMAAGPKALAGGVAGTIVNAIRYGVARGVFSNEAGLGSAPITAACATTDNHVKQGYVNMTGTFFDTIIVCTITGLAIAASGVIGMTDANGELLDGAKLTIAAFETVLGHSGAILVTIAITLCAFSTILGWEYYGEKSFEFLFKTPKFSMIYRVVFSLIVYWGATASLDIAWTFSDIMNALMAIPNLISLLALSGVIAKDASEYQKVVTSEKLERKAAKKV